MIIKSFHTIGIGVAFSPNLKANLYEAARLSLFFGARLVLIHVGKASEDKVKALKIILNAFKKDHLDYEVIFKMGNPVEAILSTASEQKIDLLILGALKRENIVKFYLGSIARKIARKAKCSILLLIKPSVVREPCTHIVVNGLQDSKTEQTIGAAFFVATKLGSKKITIVEEISQGEVAIKIEDDKSLRRATIVKERIKLREDSRVKKIIEDVPQKLKKNIIIKTQPIFGRKGYSIGHYAQVVRADLLVMNGLNKTSIWTRLFARDLEHILTELPTDVLIVQ